jgi:hypothetical protein
MTGWIATRLGALESRVEYLIRLIGDIVQQLRAVQQAAKGVGSDYGTIPSGGAGQGAFFAMSSSGSWGATGSWPSLTPGSISATVYQATGTTLTSLGTFTIYNWFPASPVASKVILVEPDNTGNYVVVTQSCT